MKKIKIDKNSKIRLLLIPNRVLTRPLSSGLQSNLSRHWEFFKPFLSAAKLSWNVLPSTTLGKQLKLLGIIVAPTHPWASNTAFVFRHQLVHTQVIPKGDIIIYSFKWPHSLLLGEVSKMTVVQNNAYNQSSQEFTSSVLGLKSLIRGQLNIDCCPK